MYILMHYEFDMEQQDHARLGDVEDRYWFT